MSVKRKGARTIAEIPPSILKQLNAGELETANLVEALAIDFSKLLATALPNIPEKSVKQIKQTKDLGWVGKTKLASQIIFENYQGKNIYKTLDKIIGHRSDNVRGWGAGIIALIPDISLSERLKLITPLADDKHFGTRELAWMLMRNRVAEELDESLTIFKKWVEHDSENIRRYASEITRPRGVWCAHITPLKQNPSLGLNILQPLHADKSRYVQNSVANWLNDAAKSDADFVLKLTTKWQKQSKSPETAYIVKRARRSFSGIKKTIKKLKN